MSKCTIMAHVRRPDGSIVQSNLFKDLLHYAKNRQEAKEHYAVATNKEFIDLVGDRAEFDENGEMTFNSYKDLVGMEEDTKLVNTLNKDIQAGVYEYGDAMTRLQDFNRNNPFRKSYMATVVPDNGKYRLLVVKRTPSNEARLEKAIHQQSVHDRILYYLNKAGVAVDFIKDGERNGGRYSTVNAERTADGLYHLIKVAHGEHLEDDLAEECGHFVIGAMGDNPLVERLTALLDDDVQKQILGDKYEDKALGNNPRREVAGVLVGQALQEQLSNRTPWQKLANRIANLAKRIFYRLSGNEVRAAMMDASHIASKIAQGFASPNFNGNIETALKTQETLYSAKVSKNVATYRNVVQRLQLMSQQASKIADDEFSKLMKALDMNVEIGKGNPLANGAFADAVALDGIAEALYDIADLCGEGKEISKMLDSIDFDNLDNFFDNIVDNGRKLRQIRVFLNNSMAIAKIINDARAEEGENKLVGALDNIQLTSTGGLVSVNLAKALGALNRINEEIENQLTTKEFHFFSRFLQEYYGEKYITHATRVLFKKQNGQLIYQPVKVQGKTTLVKDEINDKLRNLESDISLFETYLASMSNSSDLIGQIVDKVVKQANKTADDITRQEFDDLRILRQRWKKLGHKDTSILFEVGRDGKLTGNIISDKNWGDWESDRHDFIEAEREAFKKANPDLQAKSEIEIGLLWDMWLKPKMKDWNDKHSIYDEDKERWVPNNDYKNDNFERIVPQNSEMRKWYNDYMQLKMNIDKMLPEGSTLTVRMPQFRGTFMNKVQNRHMFEDKAQAFKHTLRSSLRDTFCETSEDSDFGNLQTYNSEEESLVYNPMEYEKEKMNRIPLYGINKLTSVQKYKTMEKDVNGDDIEVERTKRVVDMSDLSTDLFHTTLAYASMANSYKAVDSTVDILEVGRSVLNERTVAGVKREPEKDSKSRAYKRYVKYLEKQVYGISMPKHKIGNVVLEKIAGLCTRISAYMFLGGNVYGGMVNLGTGFIEVLKEAGAGENYNMKDWKDANKFYFDWLVRNFGSVMTDYGKLDADNFMDLLSMRWNIFGENKQDFKDWETRHSWIRNTIDKLWFMPYKVGEHYMQLIPFIAMAKNQKLWEANGRETTLMNLYKTKENEDEQTHKKSGQTLDVKWENKLYFKASNGKKQYDFIQGIIDKLSTTSPTYTKEELDYLKNHEIKIQDTKNAIRKLEVVKQSLIWTANDESLFMNAAREVANRLHGIYNNMDKVMFSQNIYGNMFLAMKGWALGAAERKFASDHYSVALGRNVEGSITTMLKLWSSAILDKKNFKAALLGTVCPLSKKAYLKIAEAGFSVNQFRNMRRNWGDLMAIAILTILKMLTAKPPEDEEDEETLKALYGKNWKKHKKQNDDETTFSEVVVGGIYYMASRLLREQMAFNSIRGAYRESGSLLNIKPAGFSAVADLVSLMYEGIGALVSTNKENKDFFYQGSKKGKYEEGDPKFINHSVRYLPYYRSIYTFKHPYEAAKSFDFGKDVQNR